MLDLDELNPFEKYSIGTFALVSGMAIIGTGAFFFYVIYPFFSVDKTAFYFSLVGLSMCALAPLMFYLSELTDVSSIMGKFISGLILAGFATMLYHVSRERGLTFGSQILEIFLTGLFAFLTSFFLVRGVIVPVIEEEYSMGGGYEEDEFIEEEAEYTVEEDYTEDEDLDEDKFIDEEDEPW